MRGEARGGDGACAPSATAGPALVVPADDTEPAAGALEGSGADADCAGGEGKREAAEARRATPASAPLPAVPASPIWVV